MFRETLLSSITDPPKRDRWARLRFAIIGPLLAAPPPTRELHGALRALAAKTWRHPVSGLDVRFGVSTLERWYYAARRKPDPVAALRNRVRRDIGRFPSLTAALIETLRAQYREHPGWSVRLHLDNLNATLAGAGSPRPSYPTIRRYLLANAMVRQARPRHASQGALLAADRLARLEVRSFEVEHVGALWHLDFHHAKRPVLTRAGVCRGMGAGLASCLPSLLRPPHSLTRDAGSPGAGLACCSQIEAATCPASPTREAG